jgi:large subunit ribosomal protein L20
MVRGGPANRAVRKAKIFAITKGFRGRAKNCYSIAVRSAHKALQHAYRGRRLKKRDMRRLWITRVSCAAKEHDINYSRFMNGLVKCDIQLNRKVLSELAIHEPRSFQALTEIAKRRLEDGLNAALSDDQSDRPKPSCPPPSTSHLSPSQIWIPYVTREIAESDRKVMETAV